MLPNLISFFFCILMYSTHGANFQGPDQTANAQADQCFLLTIYTFSHSAAPLNEQQHDKTYLLRCKQKRLKTTCALAQSDQSSFHDLIRFFFLFIDVVYSIQGFMMLTLRCKQRRLKSACASSQSDQSSFHNLIRVCFFCFFSIH